jgi:hypothetical protein
VNGMTAEEFARRYAERSGVTVAWLEEHGRAPVPCGCGADECEGWQMTIRRSIIEEHVNAVLSRLENDA